MKTIGLVFHVHLVATAKLAVQFLDVKHALQGLFTTSGILVQQILLASQPIALI